MEINRNWNVSSYKIVDAIVVFFPLCFCIVEYTFSAPQFLHLLFTVHTHLHNISLSRSIFISLSSLNHMEFISFLKLSVFLSLVPRETMIFDTF